MPEVGIFNSPDPNAFTTGMRRNDSLIAVSPGALLPSEFQAIGGPDSSGCSLANRRSKSGLLRCNRAPKMGSFPIVNEPPPGGTAP
jgi:hypothetical protein